MRWAVGLTTVLSRRDDLLPQTLASLAAAGWDTPRLFVDNCDDPKDYVHQFGLEVTAHFPPLRVYGNWILALAELFCRNPAAERYAIFQDDIVAVRNLRRYLERCPFPLTGYWNLHTMPSNESLVRDGKRGWYRSNQFGRGAQALVFSRDGVRVLLGHQHMIDKPMDAHRGHRSVDGAVVTAMTAAGWTEYVHYPSLVQHVGRVSSFGNTPQPPSASFPGEDFNALELLGPGPEGLPCSPSETESKRHSLP